MMKKVFKTILVLGIVGVLAYKAYQFFFKQDEEDVVDGEILDEIDDEVESEGEEKEASLTEKIKAAARKVVKREA